MTTATKTTKKTAQTTSASAPSVMQFEPALPIAAIRPHTYNVRHRAAADDEMVESIRTNGVLEPVIVAPHATEPDVYVLIAGHRRVDGCKKSRRPTAPAVIRADLTTDAQQVEAMLVENLHRHDLSAIEEAEGYQQLTLFGIKQGAIAKAVGRDQKTVAARMRLLKLRTSTQKKVHDGQLSIDDALSLASFADDAATTKRLESTIGTSSFTYDLQHAKDARKRRAEVDKELAPFKAAGVPEHLMGKGDSWWNLDGSDGRPAILSRTHSTEPDDHKGCLAYVVTGNRDYPRLDLVCTAPDSHADQLDEDEKAMRAAREADDQARKEREAAEETAATVRRDLMVGHAAPGMKVDIVLVELLRVALPTLILDLVGDAREFYQDAMEIPADRRWGNTHDWKWNREKGAKDWAAAAEHRRELLEGSSFFVAKALMVVLTINLEACLDQSPDQGYPIPGASDVALSYLDLLVARGHARTPIDDILVAIAKGEGDV